MLWRFYMDEVKDTVPNSPWKFGHMKGVVVLGWPYLTGLNWVKSQKTYHFLPQLLLSLQSDWLIGPPISWCKITHAGMPVTQWDVWNKDRSSWTGTSSFVLEVPQCNLRFNMCGFVPCDWILQRACLPLSTRVQTTLLASWCHTMPFSAHALRKHFLY